jgi:glycosyltransferase involved in cell wall biosynthesis
MRRRARALRRSLRDARVVLVVPVLDFGGVETKTVIHAKLMKDRVGSIRVCCLEGDGAAAAEIRASGITVDALIASPSIRDPRTTYRLWRYLRRERPTIMHAGTGALTVHGLLAARLAGVPVRIVEEVGIPRRGTVGRLVFPLMYRLATSVIGVSDAVADYLVEHDKVDPEKVVRIYNPVDDSFFVPAAPLPQAAGEHLVTVGRLVPEKAQDVLLDAVADLLPAHPHLTLTLVGDGPCRRALEAQVSRLGIADAVRFLGHRTDVRAILATADCFVLPSRSEGLGIALVEGMAARVPCVATTVGGVPEVMAGFPDLVVPPDDHRRLSGALAAVLVMTPGDRAELGDRLAARARELFSATAFVDDVSRLYESLLAGSGAR